jgi:uncharacterized protein YqgC (DUF456 family)
MILVLFLSLAGIIGAFAPGIPGPPLNYAALWVVQYKYHPFSNTFMIVWAVIITMSIIIDYLVPIWFAKKFGATKYGIWGSIIGMIVGIFFTPIGMVLGMLIGAIVGELIGGSEGGTAVKSGLATFAGTMLTMGLKLIVSVVISIYIFVEFTRIGF